MKELCDRMGDAEGEEVAAGRTQAGAHNGKTRTPHNDVRNKNIHTVCIYIYIILLGINSIEYRTWAYDSIEMKLVGQFLL